MPAALTDEKRAAILADIKTGEKGRNQIAREHGVSQSTVSLIAQDAGLKDAFDRTTTKHATAAVTADNKARRAAISSRLLAKADEFLDQLEQPHLVFNFGGKDNTYEERELDRPPTADMRNLMTCAAIALDKHAVLEKIDGDQGVEGARAMILDLASALRGAASDHAADAAVDEPPATE